ncbi:hypothetical protein G6F24_016083 [Rhizopus arrhizus]|nr:hypothetical protein G6F24_016083 [Rhizopus arrhizus]
MYAFMLCPIVLVVWLSFFKDAILYFPPSGYTLSWYVKAWQNPAFANGFLFSLQVSLVAAAIGVVMGVLVQQAAASDSSGVMITRDPFDASRRYVTYISAKRGLGIKVVEGKRQAEQLMYSSWSKAVQVLSRSAEDTQLVADAAGGVREVPIEGSRQVLNDALVARLAAVGNQIKATRS